MLNIIGLIPYDGVPREEIVTIHPALTGVYVTLACVGIAFAIACLIFNFICRNEKYKYKILKLIAIISYTLIG